MKKPYNTKIAAMLWGKQLNGDVKIQSTLCSQYAVLLLRALASLDTEKLYKSRIHGQGHIERVMLLGAMIAKGEQLTAHETELLLFACSYHDIGRVDDSRDDEHGRRSAQMIVDTGLWKRFGCGSDEELRAVQAAICTHSVKDSRLSDFAEEFGVPDALMPLCRKLCFCLKDADNLDRVRLHDLDSKHLRHEFSVKLVPTAEYIYKAYTELP